MQNFSDFVQRLMQALDDIEADPELQAAFNEDPYQTLIRVAELSAEDQQNVAGYDFFMKRYFRRSCPVPPETSVTTIPPQDARQSA